MPGSHLPVVEEAGQDDARRHHCGVLSGRPSLGARVHALHADIESVPVASGHRARSAGGPGVIATASGAHVDRAVATDAQLTERRRQVGATVEGHPTCVVQPVSRSPGVMPEDPDGGEGADRGGASATLPAFEFGDRQPSGAEALRQI
jgi:hypothetical protein